LDEVLHRRKDITKDDQADENARHGKSAAANPIEVAAGAIFAHQQHNDGASVEWRNRKKIKYSEKKIQRKEDKKKDDAEAVGPARIAPFEEVKSCAESKAKGAQDHEREICGGTGECH